MRTGLGYILILLGVMGIQVGAVAEPESYQPPAPLIAEHKNTVMFDFGTYNLAKHSQDWNIGGPYQTGGCFLFFFCSGPGYGWSPLANQFDTSSRDVFGIEYERHFKHGFSLGLNYFQIKNSFVIPSVTPSQGEVKTKFYFITGKKYFANPDGLRPFIGLGVGGVSAKIGGYVNKSASGTAAKAEAGLSYQSGRMRFVAGYRYIYTSILSGLGGAASYTGDVFGNLDLSGRGGFIGLGISF